MAKIDSTERLVFETAAGDAPVTELESWAAEVEAGAAAGRLLAQAIANGHDAEELEGAARVLAGRLEQISDELGKLGTLDRMAGDA